MSDTPTAPPPEDKSIAASADAAGASGVASAGKSIAAAAERSDSSAPPAADPPDSRRRAPSIRSTTALFTAITGLIAAIAAFHRTPPEPQAQESYQVLQQAFTAQEVELTNVKKDLVDLRGAFEKYARAKEGDENVRVENVEPASNGVIPGFQVHVQKSTPPPSSASPARSTVTIPSTRPPPPIRPLPDVREIETIAKAKD